MELKLLVELLFRSAAAEERTGSLNGVVNHQRSMR
jgi:hypothetical protein